LSNDRICKELNELREVFHGSETFEDQVATFLRTFLLSEPDKLRSKVEGWVQQCKPAP